MIDRLRQMAIFAKAIDHGSFRGAAQDLNLSPSVVSHHITQLEEHLGVALIYRSTRKLSLTAEGEKLLNATRNMLAAVEGELLELAASATAPSGKLRLTLPSVLSQSPFIKKIADFSERYPKVELELDFSDLRRDLIASGFDISIGMRPNSERAANSRVLFRVQRLLVASADYLETRAGVNAPVDTLDWDWLLLSPVQNVPVSFRHSEKGAQEIKPKGRLHCNDAQALYRFCREGMGLALLPDFLAAADIAQGRVCHVLPEWSLAPIDVYATWPRNAPKHGLVHLLLNALSGS